MSDTKQLSHYIDGQWVAGAAALGQPQSFRHARHRRQGARRRQSHGECRGGRGESRFPGWANASPEVRSDLLDKVGSTDHGARRRSRPAAVARRRQDACPKARAKSCAPARIFKFFAGEALRRHGVTVDSTRPGVAVETYREPLGVFGLITPWNFPIAIPAWKSAPALAFGNTVVMKPASLTPATAHALTEIIHEAGFPKGVFNLILGGGVDGRRARRASGCRRRVVHRRPEHRRAGRARRDVAQRARAARDGRQESAGRARRLRSRSRRAMRARRRLLRHRPALHGFEPHHRHAEHPRQVRRSAGRARQGAEGRRCARRRHADGPARERGAARHHSLLCRHRDQGRRPHGRRRRSADARDARLLRCARADRGHEAWTCASTAKKSSARSPRPCA